ncbi:MAG: hypothetical protein ACKN9T_10600, partial [Candidatus Methylumidiphilus sp.]
IVNINILRKSYITEEFERLSIDVEKLPTYRMGMKKGMEQGVGQGIERGAHGQALAIATKLLAEGMEPAWIAAIPGLPQVEIERLR